MAQAVVAAVAVVPVVAAQVAVAVPAAAAVVAEQVLYLEELQIMLQDSQQPQPYQLEKYGMIIPMLV